MNPAPPPSEPDLTSLAENILHGFVQGLTSSPWLLALLALVVVLGAVRSARSVIHSRHPKDEVRLFSRGDRLVIFERAGGRCEFHVAVFGRCRATSGLQADHVHPHGRGGSTFLGNGQALCERHNREKSARVPWDWQLRRLATRRAEYFAEGHDPVVARYRPSSSVSVRSEV